MILDWCFIQLVTSRANKTTITSKNTKRKSCLEPVSKFTYNNEKKINQVSLSLDNCKTSDIRYTCVHKSKYIAMLSDKSISQVRGVKFTSQENVPLSSETFFLCSY